MNTEATRQNNDKVLATGVRLRNAREELGLSQKAVAERLCLKISTIRDLEEDKVSTDLASTFLRGYIRSYAKLVHLPEEELLPMMEKQVPVRAIKVTSMQTLSLGGCSKKRDSWLMIFTWLVLFVVVGLTGVWWWQNHKAQREEIVTMINQSPIELSGMANMDNGVHNVPLNIDGALAINESQVGANNTSQDIGLMLSDIPAATTHTQTTVQNDITDSLNHTTVDTVQVVDNNVADTHPPSINQDGVVVSHDLNALSVSFTYMLAKSD